MAELEEKVKELNGRQDKVELNIVAIKKDIEYMKGRLDNGISKTVTKTWDGMNQIKDTISELRLCIAEKIFPLKEQVKANSSWREKMQRNIIRIGLSGMGISGLATILYFLLRGK